MAGVLGRTALLSSLKKSTSKASGGLLLRGVNRSASNGILTEGSKDTLIAIAGAGMLGVTCYAVYTGLLNPSRGGQRFNSQLDAKKIKDYSKTNATHPEAEAEKLIAVEVIPDAPPTKPIVGTEVVAEALPTKLKTDNLELPSHVPYVLIGAGTASFAAAKAIRESDPKAKVLIVGEEEFTPYSRPPLSKQLWLYEDHDATKELKFKASWSGGKLVDPFYKWNFCDPKELSLKEEGGIAVLTGTKATNLNPTAKKLTLDSGTVISFDKCLIATGGRPKNLPLFAEASEKLKEKVSLYRTISDYQKLDNLVGKVDSVLVVGGGFLGSELAVGVASRGKSRGLKVTQLFPEEGILGLVLPKDLCKWTTEKVRQEGVAVMPGTVVSKISLSEEGKVVADLSDGSQLETDHVIVAVGLQPNTSLATSARLEIDPTLGGYRVNAELQACSDVWVAGDVSCFFDPRLGRRRVEHHDHANVSGRLAGENMAGSHKRFDHQSMFWSDLGPEVGFEATGLINGDLPTIGVWAKTSDSDMPVDDFSKGVIFYLGPETRKIVGILTWNLFGRMDTAKKVISEEKTEIEIGDIVAKFELNKQD